MADLILTLEQRPILLRLHITIDGQSYTRHWENQLKRLVRLPRPRQRRLPRQGGSAAGPERRTPIAVVRRQYQLRHHEPTQRRYRTPFDELDVNTDGKISFEEFARFYRHSEAGPIQLLAQNSQGLGANNLTEILFRGARLQQRWPTVQGRTAGGGKSAACFRPERRRTRQRPGANGGHTNHGRRSARQRLVSGRPPARQAVSERPGSVGAAQTRRVRLFTECPPSRKSWPTTTKAKSRS